MENPSLKGRGLVRHGLEAAVMWKAGVENLPRGGRGDAESHREREFSAAQRKCSANVVRVASSEGLVRRSSVMVSTEYMTVEWCLAKSLPISG